MPGPTQPLPKDLQPVDWADENRLNVLFGPFRSRTANAKDWDNKYEFWRKLIVSYCVHFKQQSFTLETLQRAFVHNGKVPVCLNDVLTEMERNKQIQRLANFNRAQSASWAGWATDVMIKRPIVWSFTTLKSYVVAPGKVDVADVSYVHPEALDQMASQLLGDVLKSKQKLFELSEIAGMDMFKYVENVDLLMRYLLSTRRCHMRELRIDNTTTTLFKFKTDKQDSRISDKEIDIYTLQRTERMISDSLGKLETELVTITEDAKNHLTKNHRQLAKTALRKKKEIEKRIEQRANNLVNIQTLLIRLEETDDNSLVVDSYKKALSSLRTAFKDQNLNEDGISDTMVDIADVLDIHNDIQTSLANPVQDLDDAELENELAELMKDDTAPTSPPKDSSSSPPKKDVKKVVDDDKDESTVDLEERLKTLRLPAVPQHMPSLNEI